jgi:hypothetical protein
VAPDERVGWGGRGARHRQNNRSRRLVLWFMHIVDTCGSRVYVASVARGSHGEAAERSHQMRRN